MRRRQAASAMSLLIAALLTGTYALPAYATVPSSTAPLVNRVASATHERQTLQVASGESAPVARDTYASAAAPKPSASDRSSGIIVSKVAGGSIRWPLDVAAPISDGFGYRTAPCAGCSSYHEGIDINPGAGTPIYAIADGVVREVGNPSGALGVCAIIDHRIGGEMVSSLYAHMQLGSLALRAGESVTVGQLVGLVGSTGASTGPHLHLGIMVEGAFVDPYAWLTQRVG
ncbi:M23 family metallopeptidase [Humibacter ginsenosidimutans]|uniref:M23 family metallopeptidase n=1 Tax=Humibacter ginsenosidimutans TaxID=2599293 RepID=UPI00143D62C7|nr:M23 family metallopeptidase [Humibacter ginsenosidimutans]